MFNIFREKSQVEALIAKDGIEHVTDRFAEFVSRKLTSREIAYQFILEEIQGASMGNSASKRFASNSGIHPEEYWGAMANSMPEVDGPDGPQQLLLASSLQLANNQELMAEFRCRINDKIMQKFGLGKYGKEEDRIRELLVSLRNILTDDMDVMPALTQNIPAPADAKRTQINNREKNIASAEKLIIELSKITGEGNDSIIRSALRIKTKPSKDPYLEKVASILHSTMGPALPLQNSYDLAEECLGELRSNISKGMFHDGANPREILMAYYSLCSMVNESVPSDDKMRLLEISIMARLLIDKIGDLDDLSSLEKGICQFGEHALLEGSLEYTKDDVARIKLDAVKIIMDLMSEQGANVSQESVSKIVENNSSNVGDKEVCKVGEKVLALSVLSNATGYFIDQGEIDIAHSYFLCIDAAIDKYKYSKGQMESFSDHQSNAVREIMKDYSSLGNELVQLLRARAELTSG